MCANSKCRHTGVLFSNGESSQHMYPEHVSGARAADLPLSAQAYFVTPALRCAASRSMLRSRSSVFWYVRSPLRSRSANFLPAPLRFPHRSRSAHMFCNYMYHREKWKRFFLCQLIKRYIFNIFRFLSASIALLKVNWTDFRLLTVYFAS